MPQTLYKTGQELSKEFAGIHRGIFDDAVVIFKDLDVLLIRRAKEVLDVIYGKGSFTRKQPDMSLLNRRKKSLMSSLTAPVDGYYEKIARLTVEGEEEIFKLYVNRLLDKSRELYPVRVKRQKKDVTFEGVDFGRLVIPFLGASEFLSLCESVSKNRSSFVYVLGVQYEKVLAQTVMESVKEKPKPLKSLRDLKERFYTGPILEGGNVILNVSKGGVSRDFKQFLGQRLTPGVDPADLIRTMSARQVEITRRVFLDSVNRGMTLGETKSAILKRFSSEITSNAAKTPSQFEVMRVLRDSHAQASNAGVSAFSERNSHLVAELERVADGRPCASCVCLDGTVSPAGSTMEDHISGMCSWITRMKSLEELGVPYRPEYGDAWRAERRTHPTKLSQFYGASEKNQAKLFPSRSLYNLWRQEKFPLEKLVVRDPRRGFVPMSFRRANSMIADLGGISNPKVGLAYPSKLSSGFTTANDKAFLEILDPIDRATSNQFVIRDLRIENFDATNQYGQNLFGMGTDAKLPDGKFHAVRDLVSSGNPEKLSWHEFNVYARELGLYTRKAVNGDLYWIVPKSKIDNVVKGVAKKVVPKGAGEFVPAKTVADAKAWALDRFGNNVSYFGTDNLEHINRVNKQLDELFSLSKLNKIDVSVQRLRAGTFAESNLKEIVFDESIFDVKKLSKKYRETVLNFRKIIDKQTALEQKGMFPGLVNPKLNSLLETVGFDRRYVLIKGREIESIVTHELGHVLTDQKLGFVNHVYKKLGAAKSKEFADEWVGIVNKLHVSGKIKDVSYYAAQSSNECFSECFTMYFYERNKLPEYVVKYIARVIEL